MVRLHHRFMSGSKATGRSSSRKRLVKTKRTKRFAKFTKASLRKKMGKTIGVRVQLLWQLPDSCILSDLYLLYISCRDDISLYFVLSSFTSHVSCFVQFSFLAWGWISQVKAIKLPSTVRTLMYSLSLTLKFLAWMTSS